MDVSDIPEEDLEDCLTFVSRRRTKEVQGCINFPIDDPKYRCTGEGGMFVRLVVLAEEDGSDVVCSGGDHNFLYDESFLGDDSGRPDREAIDECFPCINDAGIPYDEIYRKYASIPCLVTMVIGSTGWSGWTEEDGGHYFRATRDYLTPLGWNLYEAVQDAYPGKKIRLQTWLDT